MLVLSQALLSLRLAQFGSLTALLSAAVQVAPFPEVWLLTPQFGGSDTLPDDVPATPPGLLQDFSTRGTCPHTGWLGEHHWLPQKHSRRRDPDEPSSISGCALIQAAAVSFLRSGKRSIVWWLCISTRIVPKFLPRRKEKSSIPSSDTRSTAAVGRTMIRRRIVVGDV